MGTSTTTANNTLKAILQAVNWANLLDNTATSPNTNLYASLHTADPGPGGTQNTSECNYTGYTRVAIARTTGGWAVTTNSASPVAAITWPVGTGGSGSAAFWAIGMLSSGAGILLWSGAVTPAIPTGNTVTPQLSTASTIAIT